MQPLHQAIATALQEVARGIAAARPLSPELSRLAPDRLRLNLNFALNETGTQANAASGPHSLTLEFQLGAAVENPPVAVMNPVTALPTGDSVGDIFGTLQQIFGAPGFDSSARATVFREALANLEHEHARGAAARLQPGVSPSADAATRLAGDVLRGICRSGPLKNAARGGELLTALLDRHPLAAVLAVAAVDWKTHEDWLG